MQYHRLITPRRVLTLLAGLLILKVTVSVVLKYRDYFPPNFDVEFLQGRADYFFGSYRWAFYSHIASGPVSLILGLVLISERFRQKFPRWHRYLGRVQVPLVLFWVAPSGLWMAYWAQAGPAAGLGFAALAIITGTTVALGWRAAVKRRFAEHRRWMWRCFLAVCAAVVLRLIGGLAVVTGSHATWIDPVAAWACWLVPLLIYEVSQARRKPIRESSLARRTKSTAGQQA